MAAGIATPPVEGRWGAAVWGKDQSWGSGPYQAGVWGGDPNQYGVIIAVPNQALKRQAQASLVRTDGSALKRQAQASFVRKP